MKILGEMEMKDQEIRAQVLDINVVNDNKNSQKTASNETLATTANAGIATGLTEISGRYGEASKEFLVALDGVDNATGKTLHRSLQDIANYKINPEFESQNLNQQAGFTAEVIEVAKQDSENIINKNPIRYTRTDDVGSVNDQFVDIVSSDGSVAMQMKMVGSSPQNCLKALDKADYEKYLYSDKTKTIGIPKEYLVEVKALCDSEIQSLTEQIQAMQEKGVSPEAIEKAKKQLEKYKLIKEKTVPASSTKAEAMDARINPEKYTREQMIGISHRAGLQGAAFGARIGGAVSLVKNLFAVYKDEKELKEALKDTSFDTLKGGMIGYATAFSGSFISAFMQNHEKVLVRMLGKSSLPSMIVTVSVETTKSFYSYFKGDIDAVQLAQNLGEKGTGLANSALFAATTQAIIPIPVVGAMIGGMLGYMLNSMFYQGVMDSLKEAKVQRIERMRIEAECEFLLSEILNYRKEMEEIIERYFSEHLVFFNESFNGLDSALGLNDTNGVILAANEITRKLGSKTQFETFAKFKTFMNSEEKFNL